MSTDGWWHVATAVALCLALVELVLVLGVARLVAHLPGVGRRPPSPGVPVGTRIPPLMLPRLNTGVLEPLPHGDAAHLVLFVSPSCSGCKELVPGLQPVLEQGSRRWEVTVVVCGARGRAEAFANTLVDQRVRTLLDPDGAAELAFGTQHFFPFGFEISGDGVVRARGSVNTWGQVHKLAADAALYGTQAGLAVAGTGLAVEPVGH